VAEVDVRLERVTKDFGETVAVDDLSLDIAEGEFFSLLGPSGCGKTTTLRMIGGFEEPTRGTIYLGGRDVTDLPPHKRNVNTVFQSYALFPHLNVYENVAFGLRRTKVQDGDIKTRVSDALRLVDLEGFEKRRPGQMSGGQQQRVALARAIVPRPSVVLMDEPFSGLDVQLRDSMQEETLALLRETRATCVIVTHHPEEAMRLGDRVAVMRHGRLVQVGRAEDLYHRPAELFIARLFSEINEVAYRVSGGMIDTPIGPFPAPGLEEGETAILCIRERGIKLGAAGVGLQGRVLHVKFLGDVGLIEVGVQGFEQPLKVRARENEGWSRGAEVAVEVDASRVLIFPANGSGGKPYT